MKFSLNVSFITEGLVSNLRFVIQTDENCVINIKCVVRVKDRMNFCAVAQPTIIAVYRDRLVVLVVQIRSIEGV